ncbi:M3 family metallopeptidase [Chitinophagaceae bacterium LWZ2-11]
MLQQNNTFKVYRIIWVTALIFLSFTGHTQQYDPFDGNAKSFHANMGRYFESRLQEQASRKLLLDSVRLFQKDTFFNLRNVYARLGQYEQLSISLNRHYIYYQLAGYINNKDTAGRAALNEMDAAISSINIEINEALQQPIITTLTTEQLTRSGLTKYAYLLVKAKQERSHNLSVRDEKLLSELSDNTMDRLVDRYDNLMDNIQAADITAGDKKLNPINDRGAILKSKDTAIRAIGMKAYYTAYNAHSEVLAATLIDITAQKTALAKIRGYKTAPERVYAKRLQLQEEDVRTLLEEMTLHADVFKVYQQLQTDQVKKVTGLTNVHSWDLALPMGNTWQPQSYAQTKQLILQALNPLGSVYTQNFAWLLNPENGALEIGPGTNRVTENTSIGYPGVPVSLYMKSYNGALGDVLRLSHEGGHAIHQKLMSDGKIVPSYASGPEFLFEAYAMLNELLVLDELQKQAVTIQGKAYFTKQFLDKLSFEIFTSAQEGAFEQGLYDGVAKGKINTEKEVDSLYASIMKSYDSFFINEPERHSEWINKRLLFDDPLYNVNYLYAILVTCKLYEMLHDNPAAFAGKYNALLSNGFDAPAADLLKKFMGFGLDNQALLNGALQIMKDKTDALKQLYEQMR